MRDLYSFNSPRKLVRQYQDYDEITSNPGNISRYDTWRGKTLTEILPGGVDPLTDWEMIYEEDFEDVAAILTDNSGDGPWFTNGAAPGQGLGSLATLASKPQCYTQGPSYISLRTMGGPANGGTWQANITTFGGSRDNYRGSMKAGYCMHYGLEMARIWIADPRVNYPWEFGQEGAEICATPALPWQAYWAYNISHLPGPWFVPNCNRIEPDHWETYPNGNGLGGMKSGTEQATLRTSVHHHGFQKLPNPGGYGRDAADSSNNFSILSTSGIAERFFPPETPYPGNPATFGIDPDYLFVGRWITSARLVTPEWYILLLDPFGGTNLKEIYRFRMLTEFHDHWLPIFSNCIHPNQPLTSGVNFDLEMRVDWIRAYQTPDWNSTDPLTAFWERKARIAGGSGDAMTWTSTVYPGTTIPDGTTIALRPATLNTGGPTTLAWNGGAPKRVYVHLDDANPKGSGLPYVFPTTEIDPPANMLDPDCQFGLKYRAASDSWLVLDCGRPQQPRPVFEGFPLPETTVDIDVEEAETIAAVRAGVTSLFPSGHPARAFDNLPTPPFLPPAKTFAIPSVAAAGATVGTIAPGNTPDRQTIFTMTGSTNYKIHPTTGVITVAPGATLVGSEDLIVKAWPNPPAPTILTAAVTRVRVNLLQDRPFDPLDALDCNIAVDLTDVANMVLDVDGTVSAITDLTGISNITQATTTRRWVWNPTGGPQGGGCMENPDGAANRYYSAGVAKFPTNRMGGIQISAIGSWSASVDSRSCLALLSGYTANEWHIYQWEWRSGENSVRLWLDGVELEVDRVNLESVTSSGWGVAVAKAGALESSERITVENEGNAYLFNNTSFNGGLKGAAALVYTGDGVISANTRQKVLRWAARKCWSTNPAAILPVGVSTAEPMLYS